MKSITSLNIPKQYLPVMPYLILNDAPGFLNFAKKVFDAREQLIVPDEKRKIMHGEIKIHSAVIMFANATEEWKQVNAGMYLYVENVDKVYNAAIANGARSLHSPDKKDYGYTAGFEDPFGNQWFVVEPEQ